MSVEKTNDFNDVHTPRRAYLSAHHPSVINGCWCGATTGPLRWGDRLWCGDCIPDAGKAVAVSELRGSGAASLTLADLHRSLTRIEALLCQALEAIAPPKDPAAPSSPMPLQPGDRAIYNGRRGVLRSIGVAGTGILYDDGRYALLTNAMAAKLVRESNRTARAIRRASAAKDTARTTTTTDRTAGGAVTAAPVGPKSLSTSTH